MLLLLLLELLQLALTLLLFFFVLSNHKTGMERGTARSEFHARSFDCLGIAATESRP